MNAFALVTVASADTENKVPSAENPDISRDKSLEYGL